jgi:hypothetical protein
MGFHPARHGGYEDKQSESPFHDWRLQDTDLDNAPCAGVIHIIYSSEYQLFGSPVWIAFWLWM